jgi:molybdopterin molybdotransferase
VPEPETPLAERPREDVERLLSVDDALARVLAMVAPLPVASLPLLDASGLVLAEDIVAPEDVPPFRNSAMDGFAVRAKDTAEARFDRPLTLRVHGTAAAGSTTRLAVAPGCAIRIMTGAPLPDGADAVVRFEETDEGRLNGPGVVGVLRSARPGDNVREAGEDIFRGTAVLPAGRALRAADLGQLAALGFTTAPVHRRPRVAILSTGDEVVEPGAPLPFGKIRDANATTLAALARGWGAETVALGIARDRLPELTERLTNAADADLIVTSGGVSLGDYDVVKDALRQSGEIAVWQVRMKPGKPLALGRVGGVPLLGLPGNPVAAAVSFVVFGRPAIRRLLGHADLQPRSVEATLIEPLDNRGMRRHYVRALLEPGADGGWTARPAGAQGAGVLSSLSRANALLVLPESIEQAEPGMTFRAILLDANA